MTKTATKIPKNCNQNTELGNKQMFLKDYFRGEKLLLEVPSLFQAEKPFLKLSLNGLYTAQTWITQYNDYQISDG